MEELARTTSRPASVAGPEQSRRSRKRLAQLLPISVCLIACALLGVAAAAHGQLAAALLAIWVGALAVIGWRASTSRRPRRASLMIATLTLGGEVRDSRRLAVVPTKQAVRVLRRRPRG